jgi:hypothetical protein
MQRARDMYLAVDVNHEEIIFWGKGISVPYTKLFTLPLQKLTNADVDIFGTDFYYDLNFPFNYLLFWVYHIFQGGIDTHYNLVHPQN